MTDAQSIARDHTQGCYTPIGDEHEWQLFHPTRYAATAWGPGMQHGSPVAGLLTRALERCEPVEGTRLSRISVDILGAVPMSQVRVSARLERPGRRIALVSAQMQAQLPDGTWRPVAQARGWRLATSDTSEVARHADVGLTAPENDQIGVNQFPQTWRVGFLDAVGCHFASPAGLPGDPTVGWIHMTQPLVAGEPSSDLVQVMSIADVANGIGARLDVRRWTFLNTDLTVHLFEEPRGPWFGLVAETSIGHDGIGMSAATIHGTHGPIGRLAQNILAERRAQPLTESELQRGSSVP